MGDISLAHAITPPRRWAHSPGWHAECSCGLCVVGETSQEVREALAPCYRAAEERARRGWPAAEGVPRPRAASADTEDTASTGGAGSGSHSQHQA